MSQLYRATLGAIAALALGGAAWVDPTPLPPPAAAGTPSASAQAPPGLLEVASWTLAGHHLTLTLHGSAAALDRLRAERRLSIQVHWSRLGPGGAPDLVTEIPVGRADLVPALAGEVRRQGYFAWHSRAQKDALSPGPWTVSLTGPDGSPLPCAPQQAPCRLTFTAG